MVARSTFVDLANRLFTQTFVEFMVDIRYVKARAAQAYNPSGGVSIGPEETPCIGPLLKWADNKIDGDLIRVGDRILKIRDSELGFTPNVEDYLILSSTRITLPANRWSIQNWSADPGGVVYDLHVRAKP